MCKPIFKEGDKVKIVNYGHLYWVSKKYKHDSMPFLKDNSPIISENKDFYFYDMSPHLVGKDAIVVEVTVTQNIVQYGLKWKETGLYSSWYSENQLELN